MSGFSVVITFHGAARHFVATGVFLAILEVLIIIIQPAPFFYDGRVSQCRLR
ncbi:hypothetical protein BDW62DRAFT_17116 [Aspergillus aurantiobrunneus]